MNPIQHFTISISPEHISAWGWFFTVFFILAALFMGIITTGTKRWDQGAFGGVTVALALAAMIFGFGSSIAQSNLDIDVREAAIDEALAERGINDPIDLGNDIYVLTLDGDTAIYTTLGDGNTITFYQTTE